MTGFALVHGAWYGAWSMEPLAAALVERGHEAISIELPGDDESAGFAEYVEVILDAMPAAGHEAVLVGHSLTGLTVPLVAARRPLRRLVFLCAMVPVPGMSLVEQLEREPEIFAPGFDGAPARDERERSHWPDSEQAIHDLFGDCPRELAEWAAARLRPQGRRPNVDRCPLEAWPEVPCAYILGSEDTLINPAWSRRAARERLGVAPVEIEAGHSAPFAAPEAVADALMHLDSGGG